MKGADKIIKLRLMGRKPAVINLWDYPVSWQLEPQEVDVYGNHIQHLDLRFVMDCLVTVTSETRNKELEDLCYACGAKQVASGPWVKFY